MSIKDNKAWDFDNYQKLTPEEKVIKVSDDFIEIYKNFNVASQEEKMKKLSKRELYLLLTLCLDNHSDEDPVCVNNYKPFSKELNELFLIQDDKETVDIDINNLINETNDKYIDVELLRDKNNNKLPEPMKKDEVRDSKIDNVLDNQK